jgi:hypothetical protein
LELQKHTRSHLVTDAWLLASGDDARWCKLPDCPRIIAFEPSEPPIDPGLKKNARGNTRLVRTRSFVVTHTPREGVPGAGLGSPQSSDPTTCCQLVGRNLTSSQSASMVSEGSAFSTLSVPPLPSSPRVKESKPLTFFLGLWVNEQPCLASALLGQGWGGVQMSLFVRVWSLMHVYTSVTSALCFQLLMKSACAV